MCFLIEMSAASKFTKVIIIILCANNIIFFTYQNKNVLFLLKDKSIQQDYKNTDKNINIDIPKLKHITETIISTKINNSVKSDKLGIQEKIIPDVTKVSSQKSPPLINGLKTDKSIIFLGIDDGLERNAEVLKFFEDKKWPVTLFINKIHYDKDPAFFKSILDTGANLGNHTINHPNLENLNFEQQKKEICDAQENYRKDFGITPKLFRPPFGNYNFNTKLAVKECGMVALINWKARVDEGRVWYQVGDKLKKGEIVLMHFRPRMMEDLKAFNDEIQKEGLEVGNLNDWIE